MGQTPSVREQTTEDDQSETLGPCTTPAEAFLRARLQAAEAAGQVERRSRWWRHSWLAKCRLPSPQMMQVCANNNVAFGTLHSYLAVIADQSNRNGSQPVYLKRVTIGERMGGFSKATVSRCRKASIELGFHSTCHQARWMNPEVKEGSNPWSGGSATLFLTNPDHQILPATQKAIEHQLRLRRRRDAQHQAAMERKAAKDAQHREWMDRELANAPTRTVDRTALNNPAHKKALASIREKLHDATGPP